MRILVTGGAGYIGSVAVKQLIRVGHQVVVIDNLSKGIRALVDSAAEFIEGDLLDRDLLSGIFKKYTFDSVMHFASYKDVFESSQNPEKYSQNIAGSISLLDTMLAHGVKQIIFSSSAAVYGEPSYTPVDENHPTNPINYYGFTKLKIEEIIQWYSSLRGLRYVIFRYFNVAGDGGLGYVDPIAKNVMPVIMDVLTGKRAKMVVFGDDYDTVDGTCIRDYIDINDLVDAHLKGIGLVNSEIINLGTSKGVSVFQLIKAVEKVTQKKVNFEIGRKRLGDPDVLITTFEKAKNVLNWEPKVFLEEMIKSTWKVYKNM